MTARGSECRYPWPRPWLGGRDPPLHERTELCSGKSGTPGLSLSWARYLTEPQSPSGCEGGGQGAEGPAAQDLAPNRTVTDPACPHHHRRAWGSARSPRAPPTVVRLCSRFLKYRKPASTTFSCLGKHTRSRTQGPGITRAASCSPPSRPPSCPSPHPDPLPAARPSSRVEPSGPARRPQPCSGSQLSRSLSDLVPSALAQAASRPSAVRRCFQRATPVGPAVRGQRLPTTRPPGPTQASGSCGLL